MHVVPQIMQQPEAFLDPQNAPKSGWAYGPPPDPIARFKGSYL